MNQRQTPRKFRGTVTVPLKEGHGLGIRALGDKAHPLDEAHVVVTFVDEILDAKASEEKKELRFTRLTSEITRVTRHEGQRGESIFSVSILAPTSGSKYDKKGAGHLGSLVNFELNVEPDSEEVLAWEYEHTHKGH